MFEPASSEDHVNMTLSDSNHGCVWPRRSVTVVGRRREADLSALYSLGRVWAAHRHASGGHSELEAALDGQVLVQPEQNAGGEGVACASRAAHLVVGNAH